MVHLEHAEATVQIIPWIGGFIAFGESRVRDAVSVRPVAINGEDVRMASA